MKVGVSLSSRNSAKRKLEAKMIGEGKTIEPAQVYELCDPGHRNFRGVVENADLNTVIKIIRGEKDYMLRVHWLMGNRKPGGIVWTDSGAVIVRKDVELVIRQFSGWKTYGIVLLDENGSEISGYCGLSISGRCGDLTYTDDREYDVGLFRGASLDLQTWDGSDIFMARNSRRIFALEKVITQLQRKKVTGFTTTRLGDIIHARRLRET